MTTISNRIGSLRPLLLSGAVLLALVPGACAAPRNPTVVVQPDPPRIAPFVRSFPQPSTRLPIITPDPPAPIQTPRKVERPSSLIDECRRLAISTPRAAMPAECAGLR